MAPIGTPDSTTDTFDLFRVDFVFSSSGSFVLKCGHYKPIELERLTMEDVKEYIVDRSIRAPKVLGLKVVHCREGDPEFTQSIKQAVDFICDDDLVVLRGGKWLKFNEDYLEALDDAIRAIAVEETEAELAETSRRRRRLQRLPRRVRIHGCRQELRHPEDRRSSADRGVGPPGCARRWRRTPTPGATACHGALSEPRHRALSAPVALRDRGENLCLLGRDPSLDRRQVEAHDAKHAEDRLDAGRGVPGLEPRQPSAGDTCLLGEAHLRQASLLPLRTHHRAELTRAANPHGDLRVHDRSHPECLRT